MQAKNSIKRVLSENRLHKKNEKQCAAFPLSGGAGGGFVTIGNFDSMSKSNSPPVFKSGTDQPGRVL